MLADFLSDNTFFGAKQVVFSSASSKTAYGTAFCLQHEAGVQLVGLTSRNNCSFVEGLGCYRRTLAYDALTDLDPSVPALYVDFSGAADLRRRVHEHFGSNLVYSCYAGSAQSHDHLNDSLEPLPGPPPRAYFAPSQIKKRNADWGAAEVARKLTSAQLAFIRRVRDPQAPWMHVTEHAGFPAAQTLVTALVEGRIDPKDGHVVVLD